MSVNFFQVACSSSHTNSEFGLCDNPSRLHAYVDVANQETWIAIVENDNNVQVTFTAIDKCNAIYRTVNPKEMESTCDGMLTYTNKIIFVELKEAKDSRWLNNGIAQVSNTINLFSSVHNIHQYSKKRAFVCNKLRPQFPYSQQEKMDQFKREHFGTILVPHNQIKIT